MNVLLWILLILAAAALVVAAAPIRFGAAASFGKSKRASGSFWISYIHPALFVYEYSSKEHKERMRIFGINPKWFRRKKRGRKDNDIDSNHSTGNTDVCVNDSDNTRNVNTDYDNDTLMAKMLRRAEKIKNDPLYAKTMEGLSGIRSGGFYKYFKDRAFRKKFLKWLKRAWKCAVTAARLDRLKLRASAGFANPAETGRMYGYFIAVKNALTPRNRAVSIEMEPVFTEKRLEAEVEFAGRTSAAIVMSNALTVALTFPYLQMRRLTKTKAKVI